MACNGVMHIEVALEWWCNEKDEGQESRTDHAAQVNQRFAVCYRAIAAASQKHMLVWAMGEQKPMVSLSCTPFFQCLASLFAALSSIRSVAAHFCVTCFSSWSARLSTSIFLPPFAIPASQSAQNQANIMVSHTQVPAADD